MNIENRRRERAKIIDDIAVMSRTSLLPVLRLIEESLASVISRTGMPITKAKVLLDVYTNQDRSEPAMICERSFIARQTMTSVLDSLEKDRMICRKPHPNDRRRKKIVLTDKGREYASKTLSELLMFEKKVCSGLAAGELTQMKKLSNKLAECVIREVSNENK